MKKIAEDNFKLHMQSFSDRIFKNLDTASCGWWMTALHEVQQKKMTAF